MNTGGCQHIPCRHLAYIFIADNTFYFIRISFFASIASPLLCMPRHGKLIEQERNEVHRLICMVIIFIPQHIGRSLIEEISQVGNYFFLTSHQFHHTRNIVRYKPSLLIGVGFYTTIPLFKTCILRPCHPCSICFTRAEPTFLMVKNMMISLSLFIETFSIVFFPHSFC